MSRSTFPFLPYLCQRLRSWRYVAVKGGASRAKAQVRGSAFDAASACPRCTLVLVTGSAALLAAQTLVFLTGAVLGLRYAPYGVVFRRLVRPRLAPPAELEPEAPPRFAQAVGAAFGATGTLGYLAGAGSLGAGAAALALAAAFLNAAFGFCLGCEVYLLLRRLSPRKEVSA